MRFATAACMQKYGNVSFATVACAKCMRYGGRGGDPYHGGGGGVATRDTEPYMFASNLSLIQTPAGLEVPASKFMTAPLCVFVVWMHTAHS